MKMMLNMHEHHSSFMNNLTLLKHTHSVVNHELITFTLVNGPIELWPYGYWLGNGCDTSPNGNIFYNNPVTFNV